MSDFDGTYNALKKDINKAEKKYRRLLKKHTKEVKQLLADKLKAASEKLEEKE